MPWNEAAWLVRKSRLSCKVRATFMSHSQTPARLFPSTKVPARTILVKGAASARQPPTRRSASENRIPLDPVDASIVSKLDGPMTIAKPYSKTGESMAITMMRVALMSDARDVICSTCRNLDAHVVSKPVGKGKLLAAFHARWSNLLRFMQLYSKMDDGCIAAGVKSKHTPALLACELHILEHALRRTNALLELRIAIRQTNANARCCSASATDVHAELAKRFRIFTAANDAHMAMLPATKHLAQVGTENCVFMPQSAFDVLSEEERTFFVQYAIKALEKGAGGKLRARAFARRAMQLLLCDLPDKVVRA